MRRACRKITVNYQAIPNWKHIHERGMRTGRFPRMSVHEGAIWRQAVRDGLGEAVSVHYDVALTGNKIDALGVDLQSLAKGGVALYRRIDVVLEYLDGYVLVEVKRRAYYASVGQVIGYAFEWHRTYPLQPVRGVVVLAGSWSGLCREFAAGCGVHLTLPPWDERRSGKPMELALRG